MIIESGISRMTLGRGELLRLHRAAGDTVVCLDGALWITRDHDLRDVVLSAGECTVIDGPGRVLIQAFQPSRLAVGPAAALAAGAARAAPRRRTQASGAVAAAACPA